MVLAQKQKVYKVVWWRIKTYQPRVQHYQHDKWFDEYENLNWRINELNKEQNQET